MKAMLRISFLLNVMMMGGLLFLWFHPQKSAVMPAQTVAAQIEAPQSPVVQTQIVSEPIRWSVLTSTNGYRAFVANLRTAGCPEATVEDIVQGDTGRAFSWERGHLGVDEDRPGPWSAQSQMKMVAYFLGQGPAPTSETVAVAAASVPVPPSAATPMALQNVDLSTLNLDDAQTQAIENIRETFWSSVGGQNQDTNDPAYLARWQKAQDAADSMFRVALGSDYWKYLVKASAQAAIQN